MPVISKRLSARAAMIDKKLSGRAAMIDAISKLAAAGALIAATLIANNYQRQMTHVTLTNQREMAESSLRVTMFNTLIGPVAGPHDQGKEISADRERLLVELLALNFHEHFEFKPLIEHVYERLVEPDTMMTPEQADKADRARRSLESIGRRVTARQLAQLVESGAYMINITVSDSISSQQRKSTRIDWRYAQYDEQLIITSPTKKCSVSLVVRKEDPDSNKSTVKVEFNTTEESRPSTNSVFDLTAFDFPYTDNTRLSDGSRFAVVLDAIDRNGWIQLKFVWFPKGWHGPRERPLDDKEFKRIRFD